MEQIKMMTKQEKLWKFIDEYSSIIDEQSILLEKYANSARFYESRCELLQKVQKYMRDPERQIVCDILANNSLLPDPSGVRYGQDLRNLIDL